MSGLAVWVGRDGRPADRTEARMMADAALHRAAHGVRTAATASAITFHLDGAEEPGLATSSPLALPGGSLLLVADARVDNRIELAARLDCRDLASRRDEAALLLEAYRRFGASFADHVIGDFAVVIWDGDRRTLVAARDRAGLRPLVYRVESERILVATEAKQILAVRDVPADLCAPRLVSMLAGGAGLPGWTCYEGVRRLPPGSTLIVNDQGVLVRSNRDVEPGDPDRGVTFEDCARALRQQLEVSVKARLDVVDTAGLLLSGGLDSTAIAGTAASLRASGAVAASLRTYSFAFREVPACDERSISDLVAAAGGFASVAVPGDDAWPLAGHPAHGPDIDGPDRFRSHVLHDRAAALARGDGATLLMSGQRGDALVGADVVDYLGRLRAEGPRAFWRDVTTHSRRIGRPRSRVLARFVLRRVPDALWPGGALPAPAMRLLRRHRWAAEIVPRWIRREALEGLGVRDVLEGERFRSPLAGVGRRHRHRLIADPQGSRNAETMERICAAAGLRYADPWADTRIADFVLGVPQYLVTPAGTPKGLLREAMRGVLPEAVRNVARKTSPAPAYERGLLDRARATVWSLIEGSRAAARGYVDQDAIRAAYAAYLAGSAPMTGRGARAFWRFLDVEDWLRRFHDR